MLYKTDWNHRLKLETKKFKEDFPEYKIISSCSSRNKKYSDKEIKQMITFKQKGMTDNVISKTIDRTYWSVVYKFSELRKEGRV